MSVLSAGWRACGAQDTSRTTRLIGHVVDSAGVPVRGAEVTVLPAQMLRATTNDSGFFAIDSIPVGKVDLAVRRLGYAPATFIAEQKPGVIGRATLRLAAVALDLPPVSVEDTLEHPWMRTFERRRITDHGIYFTRDDIVRSQVRTLSDILRRIPGVELLRSSRTGSQTVVFTRSLSSGRPCIPQMFVHSMNYSGEVDDFSPDDVQGMEVYPSISSVPVELNTQRAQSCGAIVIWTREPPPVAPKKKGGGEG
jgi:hypothetical protein